MNLSSEYYTSTAKSLINLKYCIDMGTFSIDIGKLRIAIQEKANSLLSEITEDNLKYFSSEVKKIAESVLDDYIFNIYNAYTDGVYKIEDTDLLLAFTDYKNGFQGSMSTWKELHPIVVKQETINIPNEPRIQVQKVTAQHILVGGTLIATGLLIFSNAWVALAVELLTVAIAYYKHQQKKRFQNNYDIQKRKYEIELQRMKYELVQGLTKDLEQWLKYAEEEAKSVLTNLGI